MAWLAEETRQIEAIAQRKAFIAWRFRIAKCHEKLCVTSCLPAFTKSAPCSRPLSPRFCFPSRPSAEAGPREFWAEQRRIFGAWGLLPYYSGRFPIFGARRQATLHSGSCSLAGALGSGWGTWHSFKRCLGLGPGF